MDFKIITTSLGDVLFRRDRGKDQEPLIVISWFSPDGTMVSMSLSIASEEAIKRDIAATTKEQAERWVKAQANLLC